jgi:hypothetical protein
MDAQVRWNLFSFDEVVLNRDSVVRFSEGLR